MKKIAVLFSNGTEELEALTPVDVLRRCDGVVCDIIGVGGEYVVGSHGIKVKADKEITDFCVDKYDGIIVPGGMPGATNITQNTVAVGAIKKCMQENKLVASICASPAVVLAQHNLVNGKKVTCYPAEVFIKQLSNSVYTGEHLQRDSNLITADGPESAFDFAKEIAKALGVTPKF